MKKTTPLIIGVITGTLMIALFLLFDYIKLPASSRWQYVMEVLYAGGVAWTLFLFTRSANFSPTFKAIFGQGFRCFIVITLMMVLFTWIYYASHPELATEAAKGYREWSLANETDLTPPQREAAVANVEKRFVTYTVSASIFAFLFRGVIFTAAGAVVIIMRRKN